MLIAAGLMQRLASTSFFIFCVTTAFASHASVLVIKELPLKLQMDNAIVQLAIEKKLIPLGKEMDEVAQEIAQLNQQGKLASASKDLKTLLELCDYWQVKTHNNFTCRLGALQRDWRFAVENNELPDRAFLREKSRRHLHLQWQFDNNGITFSEQAINERLQFDLQGLWQGWVLEKVAAEINKMAAQQPQPIGAISISYGNLTTAIGTAEQKKLLTGAATITVALKNQTLAVLDRQQNLRKVAHYPLSSVLVPKEGWPVEFAPSLLVRAETAIEAGVMAQALISLSVHDALEQANKLNSVTALAVTETGMFFASKEWYGVAVAEGTPWPVQKKIAIDYEIPALDVAEYRRPYVAIWIADEADKSIRQLQILGENRWLRDLRLWWRKIGRSDDALVDALAGATHKPGRYRIEWDGRDAWGNWVAPGNYQLHIEMVREHGEHELLSIPFVLNGQAVLADAKGAHEIGRVSIRLE